MRTAVFSSALVFFGLGATLSAAPDDTQSFRQRVTERENAGDLAGARRLIQQNGDTAPNARQFATFLDRHNDPDTRAAYLHWASLESDNTAKTIALRHVLLEDFLGGHSEDLQADFAKYRDAGGKDLTLPQKVTASSLYSFVTIPGPLSSFARMAALSTDLLPQDLLPALARNVVTNGFQASGNESLQPTEYLRLLTRYVGQARELQALTKNGKIVIPNCDSAETGELLKILGYRMRGTCGADIVLETVNPSRAFLTVDSAFPLTELEGDLRANRAFELTYKPTSIPVLYNPQYWQTAAGRYATGDFIDTFLNDPSLCRLYLGLSHLDRQTAEVLRKQSSPARLKVFAHVLDFYGGMFQVRNGVAVVPGSAKSWASLSGVSPNNPGAFFDRLISIDDGWMASYFDALLRIEGPTADYLTNPDRLRRFYDALRGKVTTPGPARPVFRSTTELMLLTSSLRLEQNGQVHIPGDIDVWRSLFIKHPHGKYDGKLTRSANNWRNSDDLLEALFGMSRKTVENEPLRIFLLLNDIDRERKTPVSAAFASRLVNGYRNYGAQYVVFTDAPELTEQSMQAYSNLFGRTMSVRNQLMRSDELGTLQALVEIWRILVRDGAIPLNKQNSSFAQLIAPFAETDGEADIFTAGRKGIDVLLAAASPGGSGSRGEQLVELLVGKVENRGSMGSPAENFLRIFDAQRLIPIDSIFALADQISAGKPGDPKLLKAANGQLSRLDESESLRQSLSSSEKTTYSTGYWAQRHVDSERKIDFDDLAKNAAKKDVKGTMAPLLRDSLVGMVYAYYAPPGAQVLLTNPSFVRSHDFIGPEGVAAEWRNTDVSSVGWPASSGGRLTGSLVSIPYALAEAEQNFLTPRREQALIWGDLVPQMIANVTVNRWRGIAPEQLRWVNLHVMRGRNLLALSSMQPALRTPVFDLMRRYMSAERVEAASDLLAEGDGKGVLAQVPVSVLYLLGADKQLASASPDWMSGEIAELAATDSAQLAPQAISRVFGTPKPTLMHSYQPDLLYLRTFPALMGYSSRILAESWESNNLFYAALADEVAIPAANLDAVVPEWNRSAIENIFATHLEDWPALLRSLQVLGKDARHRETPMASLTRTEN